MENEKIEKVETKSKREKTVKIIVGIVIIAAIVAGGAYICKSLFFSTPESAIRNFYASISDNQMERCITYTDIEDKLTAQVPNQTERDAILKKFVQQFNINQRTINIKILKLQKVSQDEQSAVYTIAYETDIKYQNGSTYKADQTDKLYLTKIRGTWKIVDGGGMYSAISKIMADVIEGQTSLLDGIK